MPREYRAKSHEIGTHTFHFETTFHSGTAKVTSTLERGLIHGEPGVSAWNAVKAHAEAISNKFNGFTPGTSSALTRCDSHKSSEREDEDMKRTGTLAIFLGTTLLAGVAHAAVPASEDVQAPRSSRDYDVQAPRSASEDVQAPRSANEDVQAPRAASEDVQAPRIGNEDVQAPRAASEDVQAPRTSSEDVQAPRTSSEDVQAPRTSSEDVQAPRG